MIGGSTIELLLFNNSARTLFGVFLPSVVIKPVCELWQTDVLIMYFDSIIQKK
jgi:hypothetical protein